jgi:hypothetical protein
MILHEDIIQVIKNAHAKRILIVLATGLIGDSRAWEDDYSALYLGYKSRGLDPDSLVLVRFVVRTDSSCSQGLMPVIGMWQVELGSPGPNKYGENENSRRKVDSTAMGCPQDYLDVYTVQYRVAHVQVLNEYLAPYLLSIYICASFWHAISSR